MTNQLIHASPVAIARTAEARGLQGPYAVRSRRAGKAVEVDAIGHVVGGPQPGRQAAA